MKKFILAMVLLLLLVGGGIGYQCVLKYFSESMSAQCEAIERMVYAEDAASVQKACDALSAVWSAQEKYLYYLIDHQHINDLDKTVGELAAAGAAWSVPDVLNAAAHIRITAHSLYEDESFLLKNIF